MPICRARTTQCEKTALEAGGKGRVPEVNVDIVDSSLASRPVVRFLAAGAC
jgi:hypothetical protein